jgi:uncharacterized protein (TIGR03435 family)
MTLKDLIQFAWGKVGVGTGLHATQIVGGPAWLSSIRYDVIAKAETLAPLSREDRKLMMRSLLADRFQLRVHEELRAMPHYALETARSGPKVKARTSDDGGSAFHLPVTGRHISAADVSMAQFADLLQTLIPLMDPDRQDLPVIDRTGLQGRFDFDLTWPDDLAAAIEEQLGLKVQMTRSALNVLVIDHAEKPSEN